MKIPSDVSEYVLEAAGLTADQWAYQVEADTELEDGVYNATITVESVHPIKFVTN